MGRPGGDEKVAARQRLRFLRPCEQNFHRVGDLVRLGHPAWTGLGLGHPSDVGSHHRDAVARQEGEVALRRRVQPHPHVHRRRDQDRQGGGEQHRRGEVRCVPAGHAGQRVGGGGRHHHRVGVAGELDVADIGLVGPVEQVGMGALAGERRRGERGHEFLRALGEDAAHRGAALAQSPDQVQRLVGRDAAADDEEDPPAVERSHRRATPSPGFRPRPRGRSGSGRSPSRRWRCGRA